MECGRCRDDLDKLIINQTNLPYNRSFVMQMAGERIFYIAIYNIFKK